MRTRESGSFFLRWCAPSVLPQNGDVVSDSVSDSVSGVGAAVAARAA
ncbi:hypothetical protein [Planotetraspora sp. GP83]